MPIILLLPVAIVICGFGAIGAIGSQRWLWLATGGLILFLWLYYVSAIFMMTLPD